MRIGVHAAVKPARNNVYILSAIVDAVHTHCGERHIRAEHDALGADVCEQRFHGIARAVGGEIEIQVLGVFKRVKGVTEILGDICPSYVRYYDLGIVVFLVYLHHLMKIDGVSQTQSARNVQHHYTADAIHQLKLTRSEKIKYADILRGYP